MVMNTNRPIAKARPTANKLKKTAKTVHFLFQLVHPKPPTHYLKVLGGSR